LARLDGTLATAGISRRPGSKAVGALLLHQLGDITVEREAVLNRLHAGIQRIHDGLFPVGMRHHIAAVFVGDLHGGTDLFRRSGKKLPGIECRHDATGLHVFQLRGTHAEVVSAVFLNVGNIVDFLRHIEAAEIRRFSRRRREIREIGVTTPGTEKSARRVIARPDDLAGVDRSAQAAVGAAGVTYRRETLHQVHLRHARTVNGEIFPRRHALHRRQARSHQHEVGMDLNEPGILNSLLVHTIKYVNVRKQDLLRRALRGDRERQG
jgi:hypothetical protein